MKSILGPIVALFFTCITSPLAPLAEAQELSVAVASNFTAPMEKIARAFSKATNIAVKPVYASTGKLYTMIENGGPFDLFLSADSSRPTKLYNKKLSQKPFVYAKGTAVLWSNINQLCSTKTWQEAIKFSGNNQIAIANPVLAPYGAVTMEAVKMISTPAIHNRFVFGQNVAQSLAFAHKVTGLGFTALSLVKEEKKGCYWPVQEAQKVEQSACILNSANNKVAAGRFASYLVSATTKKLLSDYGYKD